MTVIAGVFDTEADIDEVLNALYSHEIESEDVTIMRDVGIQGDSRVERSDDIDLPLIPAAMYPQTISGGSGQPAVPFVVTGLFDDLDVSQEEMTYYREIADEGAVVVFVEVADDQQAERVTNTMKANDATRVIRHD